MNPRFHFLGKSTEILHYWQMEALFLVPVMLVKSLTYVPASVLVLWE